MVAVDLSTVWFQGFTAGFLVAAVVALIRLAVKIFKRAADIGGR